MPPPVSSTLNALYFFMNTFISGVVLANPGLTGDARTAPVINTHTSIRFFRRAGHIAVESMTTTNGENNQPRNMNQLEAVG